eukprot:CAMPEP_0182557320 /NCGR_PEP_ID=MMETSP1324-20130603/1266_1 /TAXON_ID=236786 /ORGANISM="Florenciella sp., Strain RCC1587" /LENGTH=124 /DNA_ID=CAMNT_0024769349 /DNA_START=275 /DNA_END=646 /DNA_ORIENTATION=+
MSSCGVCVQLLYSITCFTPVCATPSLNLIGNESADSSLRSALLSSPSTVHEYSCRRCVNAQYFWFFSTGRHISQAPALMHRVYSSPSLPAADATKSATRSTALCHDTIGEERPADAAVRRRRRW